MTELEGTDQMSTSLMRYMTERASHMQSRAFEGIETLADWQALRPARLSELRENLSMTSVPVHEGLRCRDFGSESGNGFRMRRIGFEILPDCWSSACIYYPDPQPTQPAPGVLYVCGHARIGVQHYQYNPLMWARRGYVCLIVDTIEQSDNPGEHHGYSQESQYRWLARGYTSAGGELLNSLRALDVLAGDPAVDAERLATTGISGGGALSFYLAMVDERIKAVSTLCGISGQRDAIERRRMFGHCDCFYPLNLWGRDLSEYAALIAPRAALFCFGDNDALFHPGETAGLVARTRRIFDLYGAGDRCRLLTNPCGHENHPVFYSATQEWFDRHVAGDTRPLVERNPAAELSERQTMAFNGRPPSPNYVELLPELMCPRGNLSLPANAGEWPALRARALATLPRPRGPAVEDMPDFEDFGFWKTNQYAIEQHRALLGGLELWLETVLSAQPVTKLVISVANPGEYGQSVRGLVAGHAFANGAALAALEPRIAAGNLPPREPPVEPLGSTPRGPRNRLMTAMAMCGMTPVSLTIHDLAAALAYLRRTPPFSELEVFLHGRGEGAVAVLHCALDDDAVQGVILEDLPNSHGDGAPITGIMTRCDIPELVGLLAPRNVALVNPGQGNWNWPIRIFDILGKPEHFMLHVQTDTAFQRVLAG